MQPGISSHEILLFVSLLCRGPHRRHFHVAAGLHRLWRPNVARALTVNSSTQESSDKRPFVGRIRISVGRFGKALSTFCRVTLRVGSGQSKHLVDFFLASLLLQLRFLKDLKAELFKLPAHTCSRSITEGVLSRPHCLVFKLLRSFSFSDKSFASSCIAAARVGQCKCCIAGSLIFPGVNPQLPLDLPPLNSSIDRAASWGEESFRPTKPVALQIR